MDTMLLRYNSRRVSVPLFITALSVGFLMFLLSAKATEILAYSVPIAPSIVVSEDDTIQKILQSEFDIRIADKYAGAQITDLGKGVKRIKFTKYFNSRPVKLNIIETDFSVNPRLMIKPSLAGQTLNNKAKIKSFNEQENAIVSVNGGFFKPQTGVPLGLLMVNGRVYTGDINNRVALGIFDDGFKMAQAKVDIKLSSKKHIIKVDNINQPRTLSTHVLVYDNLWGTNSPPAPKLGVVFSVHNGKITKVSTSSIPIPEKGFVISAPMSKVREIIKDKNLKLDIKITPDWHGVKHIISGGPYLVKDGDVYVDVSAQKLHSITGRNPRTAIGYTKEGNIIIITVDGRENASVGLTLNELAWFMKKLGCENAMNLDGGGSTVMYAKGQVLNSPVVSGGIAVSNAVVVVEDEV